MSEAESAVSPSSDPLKAVADAMEAAVESAKQGAADARDTAEKALPVASHLLAKFAYNACYSISYGVVFPSVLLARSIPQDNALVHGLVDGARAAIDMVEEMKAKGDVTSHEPNAAITGGDEPTVPSVS